MSSAGDWSEVKDAASGKNYYVNKRTNVTQWEVPAEFASGGASAVAATSASDWSEVKDAASGKNYYVNKRTNVTQWEVPAGFGGGGSAAAAGASARPVAKAAAYAEPQTVDEKLAARAKKFIAARKQEKARLQPSAYARKRAAGQLKYPAGTPASAAPSAAAASASPALPQGWATAVDPGSSRTYYYTADGRTSWTIPTDNA